MALFRYKAIADSGDLVEGEMEARSSAAVIERLQGLGHLPVEAVEQRRAGAGGGRSLFVRRRVSRQDVTLFTRELAMLLGAGLTLERALEILSQELGSGESARLVGALLAEVRGGKSFHEALAAQPRAFPPVYVNMIGAAEASGTLEPVLERLADYRERADKLRERVLGALLYPAILVVAAIASILLVLVYVVPQFEQIFADAGAALPLSTRIVIAAARWLQANGLLLLIVVALGALAAAQLFRRPGPRRWLDGVLLELPLLGPILKAVLAARFCRTLGTLLANGVDLPLALQLSRDVMDNRRVAEAVESVRDAVREGGSVAQPLASAAVLPALATQMLQVGEETGRLWPTALHVADLYERKVETSLQRLFVVLEPALVVSVGLVIAGIIVSILLAVVSVNDLAF